jgi:hypothetical protein
MMGFFSRGILLVFQGQITKKAACGRRSFGPFSAKEGAIGRPNGFNRIAYRGDNPGVDFHVEKPD